MKPMWPAAALLCAVIVAGADDVRAQTRTRAVIVGTITDSGGAAIDGATVTLRRPGAPGEPLIAIATAGGSYRFFGLLPGVYELTAAQPRLQASTRTAIRVDGGATLTIDVVLAPAGATNGGTVRGGPIVDVTATGSVTRLSSGDLENLPIVGTTILQLVPGVTRLTAFGSSQAASEVVVEGSPINLLAGRTAAIHIYWMEDVAVAGLGVGAGTGEFTGVVANIALRSGTNAVSGLFEHRFTPPGLVGDNRGALTESVRKDIQAEDIVSRWDTSAQVGGPLSRDRLFFFTGAHYDRDRLLQATLVGEQAGQTPVDERSPAWLGSLTWSPTRALRVGGYFEVNRSRVVGRVGLNVTPDAANDQTTNARTWSGHADWRLSPASAISAHIGGVWLDFHGIPPERRAGPPPTITDTVRSGNVNQFQDLLGRRDLAGVSLTRWLDGAAGRGHALETGLEIERTSRRNFSGVPGGQRITINTRDSSTTVLRWEGDRTTASGWRMTVFFQDAWRAPGRVTIRPGIRFSVNRGSVPDKGTVFRTSPWSPRLGVAWDVATDHRTVIRAAYDRLHEGLYPTLFSFMNTAEITPQITSKFINGIFQSSDQTKPGSVAVADELRHAYVNQYVAGVERELFRDFSASAQYIRRDYRSFWALIDTGSQYAPVQLVDPGPDGFRGTIDDGAPVTVANLLNPNGSFTVLTNPAGAYRFYEAVQAVGQKRVSGNWQLLAAYTWSRTRGTVNPAAGDNQAGAGTDTGSTGVFFNPNRQINAEGPASFDFPHQLTLQGVYVLPVWGGIGMSAGFSYLSGGAWGRTVRFTQGLTQGAAQVVRIEPRGTRRVPAARALDVRLEKTLRLSACRCSIAIYADGFNLTNQGVPFALTLVEQSGDRFGDPNTWAAPRTVRFAVRVKF
jgi:hypothetical protein